MIATTARYKQKNTVTVHTAAATSRNLARGSIGDSKLLIQGVLSQQRPRHRSRHRRTNALQSLHLSFQTPSCQRRGNGTRSLEIKLCSPERTQQELFAERPATRTTLSSRPPAARPLRPTVLEPLAQCLHQPFICAVKWLAGTCTLDTTKGSGCSGSTQGRGHVARLAVQAEPTGPPETRSIHYFDI